MNPVKRFLIVYAVLYIAGAIGLNVWLGPPGMDSAYLDSFKDDQDRYIDVTKDIAYKKWSQNAELNPPNEGLQSDIDFVAEYKGREAFQAQQRRRGLYSTIFDVFNVGMLIVLIVRFARKPVLNLLDSGIQGVREELESAEQERVNATQGKAQAQKKLDGLDEDQIRLETETKEHIDHSRREIEAAAEHVLELLAQETRDRIQQEELAARMRVKAELVDAAIGQLEARYRESHSAEEEAALIEQFVEQVEQSHD